MEFRKLTTCIVRMFTSRYLNKPLTNISDIDINNFLCSINRFGTRADVARQVLFILFGRISKDYDVLLGIVVGWLTLTNINAVDTYKLPDYRILIKDWRITFHHSPFMPAESVLKDMYNIVYYTYYKWPTSKRAIDDDCGPDVLKIWPDRRKRRIIPGDESQLMDMVPNTQPLKQVPQQPSTTPMQIPEASRSAKKETLSIFDPTPGREVENINNRGGKKFQPMDMVPNTQPLKQVPLQPSTAPMQISEASRSVKKETLSIFDPTPGREVENINNIGGKKCQPMDMVPNTQPLKQVPQQPSTTPMQIYEASQSVKKETLSIFDPTPGREVKNINNKGGKKFRSMSQPQFNKLASESDLVHSKTRQYYNAQEINKTIRQILIFLSPYNMSLLTERFKMLPILNIETIETTVNLVVEKAIEKEGFAPLCSSLCSAMQSVEVISKNKKVTFKNLVISKCELMFDIDKAQEMDFAKKLTVCKDLEKKKKLQVEYEKYKRTSHERSVRNCRFMGELFKQKFLTPDIMMYRIEKLITKRAEEPLECLCILLKTAGKELEEIFSLNCIFDALHNIKYKNKMTKIVFMIEDVINLRMNNWNVVRFDNYAILMNKIKVIVANEQLPMADKKGDHLHDDNKISPIEPVEQPKDLVNSTTHYTINIKCKKILEDYEQLQNLDDIIYSLSEDESSVIHTRYEEFVRSMSLITLDRPISRSTVAGKIFAELLSKKILSLAAITQGIDDVLKYWNDFLMDYPQFFSYIAAIIAPLLLSQNASFDFNNLKDSCKSIRPDISSKLFTEVLYQMNSSKETQNIKEELCGILCIYNKWNMLEDITLDVFMPNNQINKYFKNDRIGVFLLSIAIYDKIKLTDNIESWICTNISAEIIKSPLFVRALTIAIVIICLKLNYSYEDFFDASHLILLKYYINLLPEHDEIQAKEVQCMFGIQIMSATLNHPAGMVLKIFNSLYQHRVISKESFERFIQEYEKIKYE